VIRFLALCGLWLCLASTAAAQPAYIDHRSYPVDFAVVQPGDPVADRPGYVWRHDGVGWYHELATVGEPGLPPKPPTIPASCVPFNAYGADLEYILRCIPRPAQPINPFTQEPFAYEVRGIYRLFMSSEFRAIVLSITPDLDNRRIILFRVLKSGGSPRVGELIPVYEDAPVNWVPLAPGEMP
jgi:hypothetical protein